MGNDGGSIPYRIDLVKTKAKEEKTDEKALARQLWLLCALSHRPLGQPVVTDALGKLYNKDAVIEYLLDRSTYGDGDQICGHVKGVKDLMDLNLTPNPTFTSSSSVGQGKSSTNKDLDQNVHSPFICPLTMKEMIGTLPFGVIKSCGCVLSEQGIKAVIQSSPSGSKSPRDGSTSPSAAEPTIPCPNCSQPFCSSDGLGSGTGSSWWLPLNPKPEHQREMLSQLVDARAAAKAAKKLKEKGTGKKRKSHHVLDDSVTPSIDFVDTTVVAATRADEPTTKRSKSSLPAATNPTNRLPNKVQAELAALEAKRKAAGMSAAVSSIYAGKGGNTIKPGGNDFFTRTFNRYA